MNRYFHPIAVVALGIACLLFSGCGGIRSDFQEKKTFRLTPGPELIRSEGDTASGRPLLVKDLDISPEFETAAFVYRTHDTRFGSDYYHNYMVPPARMLTNIISEALFASPGFTPVSPNTMADIGFQLWGKVIDLYCDIREKQAPKAVITLRLTLEKNSAGQFTQVLQKRYGASSPMERISPQAYVEGLNRAMAHILTELLRDLEHLKDGTI